VGERDRRQDRVGGPRRPPLVAFHVCEIQTPAPAGDLLPVILCRRDYRERHGKTHDSLDLLVLVQTGKTEGAQIAGQGDPGYAGVGRRVDQEHVTTEVEERLDRARFVDGAHAEDHVRQVGSEVDLGGIRR